MKEELVRQLRERPDLASFDFEKSLYFKKYIQNLNFFRKSRSSSLQLSNHSNLFRAGSAVNLQKDEHGLSRRRDLKLQFSNHEIDACEE